MKLVNLPEEVLLIIIRLLDLRSVHNLYNTCRHIRNIVTMFGVVREFNMSLNTMATVHTLKLNFFNDVAGHLLELNMCGVHDLSKTQVLPAMRRLKNLRLLNIAYTNLHLLDLVEMYKVCSTIKSVTINFHFDKPCPTGKKVTPEMVAQCQGVLKNFENVHFVGTEMNLLWSGLAEHVLKDAKLDILKYTMVERHNTFYYHMDFSPNIQFKEFQMYILNRIRCTADLLEAIASRAVDSEYVILKELNTNYCSVFSSQFFKDFFLENFGIDVNCDLGTMTPSNGNTAVMIWKKDSTKFDETFFAKLLRVVKTYFPRNILLQTNNIIPAGVNNDWYFFTPNLEEMEIKEPKKCDRDAKKRRVVSPNIPLNFDEMFKENRNVQLSLLFNHYKNCVTLPPSSNYLKKLTYLNLTGNVRYSADFFTNLFKFCDRLGTLNVEAPALINCVSPISKALPLSKSVKNLRIMDKRIDFKTLFSSLSKCKTLENVHIHNMSTDITDLTDPGTVFRQCYNLYYFLIYLPMSEAARTKKLQMLNKAKSKSGKPHLHIELFHNLIDRKYNHDPFIHVFQLEAVKEIR